VGIGGREEADCWKEGREEDVIFPSLTETETSLTQLKLDCLGPTERLFLRRRRSKDSWRLTGEAARRNCNTLEVQALFGLIYYCI
jgi:hypothetical protein